MSNTNPVTSPETSTTVTIAHHVETGRIIEAHANDILRGDKVDLAHAINVSTAQKNRVLPIDVNDIGNGVLAEVVNVSFRQNHMTRLRLDVDGVLFNLSYPDDKIILVQETEQDKIDFESESNQ